jgi:glycosyltransferase involved in cell wall biosynthesis
MSAAPKIFLDGTPLSGPPGGIRRFAEELFKALPAQWPEAEFALLSDQQDPKPQGWRKRWWSLGLPAALREQKANLFHGVDFAVPYIPVCPTIMTVHDLSPWILPDPLNQRVRERAGWLLRLRVPTLIHTPSSHVRHELIERFDWPEDRVFAIPLAAAPHLRPHKSNPTQLPYILSVATLEHRKNLPILLQACEILWNEGLDFDLLLAGQPREGFTLPPNKRTQNRIHCLGYVDEAALPSYFSNALCTVYPSLYEGFGLPVLEAMQCGSPVLASDIPVLRETGADAALYAPPNEPNAWAAALKSLLENEAERERRRALGLARAAEFSWAKTANSMKTLYERCLG